MKKTASKKKTKAKPKKKAKKVKKIIKKLKPIKKEKKVGKITHYFDKIKVVAIKLSDNLSIGDTIRIEGGENTDFKQKIVSMQLNGKKISKGKKKQEIGIKVKERAREGYQVFKI